MRVLHGEQKSGLICQLLDVGKMQKILTLNQFLEYLNWKHKNEKMYDATHQELPQNPYLLQQMNPAGSAGITW